MLAKPRPTAAAVEAEEFELLDDDRQERKSCWLLLYILLLRRKCCWCGGGVFQLFYVKFLLFIYCYTLFSRDPEREKQLRTYKMLRVLLLEFLLELSHV